MYRLILCTQNIQRQPGATGASRQAAAVRFPQILIAAGAALLLLAIATPARAEDFFWKDPVSGSFTDAERWEPFNPPFTQGPGGAADSVNFDLGVEQPYAVTGVIGQNSELAVHFDKVALFFSGTYTVPSLIVGVAKRDFGEVILTGGGVLQAQDNSIGHVADSNGVVTVINLQWAGSGELLVGTGGTGELTIENGGIVSNALGSIGHNLGSTGTVTVRSGGTWTNSGNLNVGRDGAGTLTIEPSGIVSNAAGSIGQNLGSTGTVTVRSGATWTNNSILNVGGFGTGTLTIEAGGSVSNTIGTIGFGSPLTSSVTVTGVGAIWTNSDWLMVGRESGTLTISGGGRVENGDGFIGETETASGAATVTGGSSTWINTGNLFVGNKGTGTLMVENGGSVSSDDGVVGNDAGSTGTATVTGGATWTNSDFLIVGDIGTGTLTIGAGGTVENVAGRIGNASGAIGAVTVSGGGATWTNSGTLVVGNSGTGTLMIGAGGSVSNTLAHIGSEAGSSGTVAVAGPNATWTNNGALRVGNLGAGTLTIDGGSSVSSGSGFVGRLGGSAGTVVVTGDGSTWTTGQLFVGFQSNGTLTIQGGGSVENTTGVIGSAGNSTGTVTVRGAGSTWTNSGDLLVGDLGTGTLSIENEALVDVGQMVSVNALSTVKLDGGTLRAEQLADGGGQFRWTAGTLNLTGAGGLTIGAAGFFGSSTLALGQNQTLDVDHTLTIDDGATLFVGGGLKAGRAVVNAGGQLFASGTMKDFGKKLTNHGDLILSNTIVNAPVSNDGAITALGKVTFNDLVSGPGGFFGPGVTTFNGGYNPGASPGVVPFEGHIALGAANTLAIELAGMLDGQFDRLNVLGDAQLDGALEVSLIDGFALAANQAFTILDIGGTLTGLFDGLGEGGLVGNFGGTDLRISYAGGDGNDVSLFTAAPSFAADFDEDGDVDGDDLANWKTDFGTSGAATHMQGDADGDNDVDGADFLAWQRQLGSGPPAAVTSASVPEPRGLGLALGAAVAAPLLGRFRKRVHGRALGVIRSRKRAGGPPVRGRFIFSSVSRRCAMRPVRMRRQRFGGLRRNLRSWRQAVCRACLALSSISAALGLFNWQRPALAMDFFWNNSSGGQFTKPANWLPAVGGPGGAGDTVKFDLGATVRYTVTDVGGENDRLLVHNDILRLDVTDYTLLDASATDPSFAVGVASGDTANVALNGSSGSIVRTQQSSIGHGAGSTGSVRIDAMQWLASGDLTIGDFGTGELRVANGAAVSSVSGVIGNIPNSAGTVIVSSGGATWTNEGELRVGAFGAGTLTIGAGGSVENSAGIIGEGTFGPGIPSIGAVTVSGAGAKWSNSGELSVGVSGNGTLTIGAGGSVENTVGVIGLFSGSTGRVTVSGAGSTWTNNANLHVGDLGTGNLTITDGAEVVVRGSLLANASSQVRLDGGKLTVNQFGAGGVNALDWRSGTLRLTRSSGLSIFGGGLFGASLALDAGQNLEVDAFLDISPGAELFASGQISTGQLRNDGDLILASTIISGPVVNGAGANITAIGNVTFNDPVSGPGGFFGPGTVTFNGGISPGDSPAAVSFEGDVALGDGNTLFIELGGAEAGEHDALRVAGAATLGGTLEVSLIDDFMPQAGQAFDILDWGSLSGAFASINLPMLPSGRRWDVSQLYLTGALTVLPALQADFDEDGDVDGNDLARWRTGFGTSGLATHMNGDADSDADVDGADFLAWQRQLGSAASAAAIGGSLAAVPEPGASLLLVVGGLGAAWRRAGSKV